MFLNNFHFRGFYWNFGYYFEWNNGVLQEQCPTWWAYICLLIKCFSPNQKLGLLCLTVQSLFHSTCHCFWVGEGMQTFSRRFHIHHGLMWSRSAMIISPLQKNWQILNAEWIQDLDLTNVMWFWTNCQLHMPLKRAISFWTKNSAGNDMFKLTIETLEQGVKYVQS